MPARHTLIAIVSLASLTGCAMSFAPACPDGMQPMKSELLYFGTASERGPVTPEQWNDGGAVEREESYVLNVVHGGTVAEEQAFAAIIEAYKTQFRQQAVLRVQSEVCANIP